MSMCPLLLHFHIVYKRTHFSCVAFMSRSLWKEDVQLCPEIIKRNLSSEIDWKLIWPYYALFNPVVSFSEFDRRNKQVNRKKKTKKKQTMGCWWGLEEYMNVWSFLVKLLTALGVYSSVKWFGNLCVCVCFLCPLKDRKLRQNPSMWRLLYYNEFLLRLWLGMELRIWSVVSQFSRIKY